MKIVYGNLWGYSADLFVITTNGSINKLGKAVMGRGCAKEAVDIYPEFPVELAKRLRKYGNVVQLFQFFPTGPEIATFPVKHQWMETADIELIKKSCEDLVIEVNLHDFETVVMPRPGCGYGHLKWEKVRPIIEPLLDDRFHVITFRESDA